MTFFNVGMTSLYTLMGLSIERWLIITQPGKFSLNCYTATWIIIGMAWALSFAVSAPPLLGWAYYSPETSGMRYVCVLSWSVTISQPTVGQLAIDLLIICRHTIGLSHKTDNSSRTVCHMDKQTFCHWPFDVCWTVCPRFVPVNCNHCQATFIWFPLFLVQKTKQ